MLSKSQIKQYQEIYQKVFNKPVSDKDATEQAEKLVRLVELVSKNLFININYQKGVNDGRNKD